MSGSGTKEKSMTDAPRAPAEPRAPRAGGAGPARSARTANPADERRRASRSLWAACEALLAAHQPRTLHRALDKLVSAFHCEAVALHRIDARGELEPWCARGRWVGRPGDLRACLTVPLVRGEERVGSLALRLPAGQVWTSGQLSLIRTATGALGAALGARIELERLRRQPGRDALTGLPDGRAFHSRLHGELDRARRHGLPLGVVMLDLDHFAALNARFGRVAGDRVLQEVALLLKFVLRESDTLARLGANRFAALLPEADVAPSRRCAERLRSALEEHRFERVGRITACCGVAACPRSGVDGLELLDSAERALELAKKAGRRRVAALEAPHVH
jgi:diguanylate cyclase (GGDEF)-like protein